MRSLAYDPVDITTANIVRELIRIVTGRYPPSDEDILDTLQWLRKYESPTTPSSG